MVSGVSKKIILELIFYIEYLMKFWKNKDFF